MSDNGIGTRVWRLVRRGLWLPAELYLQPARFVREIDALAADGGQFSLWQAFRQARLSPESRGALVDLLLQVVTALTWSFLLNAVLALVGVPIVWSGVAAGAAVGVAVGAAFGAGFGVAVGVAGGVVLGFGFGVDSGAFSGAAVGAVVGVAVGVGSGVVVGVAVRGAVRVAVGAVVGAGLGVAVGVAFGAEGRVATGVATGVATMVASSRLVLAPFEVIAAWQLARPTRNGLSPMAIWARHPARWDPHGRFPLPGLIALLAELQLRHPALSVEAARVVAANPTRRRTLAPAALLAIDRVVDQVITLPALGVLADDLAPLSSGDLLAPGERAELDLVTVVSEDVTGRGRAGAAPARTGAERVPLYRHTTRPGKPAGADHVQGPAGGVRAAGGVVGRRAAGDGVPPRPPAVRQDIAA